MTVSNSSIGKVCFTCHFVNGIQAQGCYIEYKCLKTMFNGNVTIKRTSLDNNIVTKCVTGIYTSSYNVTFYDTNENNTYYRQDYATRLTDQFVSGLSFTTSIISSVSSSTDVILSSPSPTLYTDSNNSKLS